MGDLRDQKKALLFLFERPFDPVYAPKPTSDGEVIFNISRDDVPSGFVPRFGGGKRPLTVNVNKPAIADRIPVEVLQIPRGKPFIPFMRSHQNAARDLIRLFRNTQNVEELKDLAASVRDKVNESLFIYCLSFCILNSQELRGMRIPPIFETFPSWFVPQPTLGKARQELTMREHMEQKSDRVVLEVGLDFTGSDLNVEHRVAYWREDYGINAHHWHWHLVYPLGLTSLGINRDRKGELFYFMHQQMLARYDMERLAVSLPRVEKFQNWREPIPAGYFSKLNVNNSGMNWGVRQDHSLMRDVTRTPENRTDVSDLELWHTRIREAINKGFMEGRRNNNIPLSDNIDIGSSDQKRGIDIIGDTLEADGELSVNFPFYGDLHNEGHVVIAYAHDADGSHNEEIGVMGDAATAMRDPVFYTWHKFIDDLFQEYKLSQRPYEESELVLPGINVERVAVSTGRDPNMLYTGWNMREIEASRGLDFGNDAVPIRVMITHLQHEAFDYHMKVNNTTNAEKTITVRIFIAPQFNESGREMTFMDQRLLWAEMDKFTHRVKPGDNIISRKSTDSSITIPPEQTFMELERGDIDLNTIPEGAYCGCGWPHHMLVPRGRPEGMSFQLFVMCTDWDQDRIDQSSTLESRSTCKNAASFCGVRDSKYPDKRPMGFPFDRRNPPSFLGRPVNNIDDYARMNNAAVQNITIKFKGTKM